MAKVRVETLMGTFIFKDVIENGIEYLHIYPASDTPMVLQMNCMSVRELYLAIQKQMGWT